MAGVPACRQSWSSFSTALTTRFDCGPSSRLVFFDVLVEKLFARHSEDAAVDALGSDFSSEKARERQRRESSEQRWRATLASKLLFPPVLEHNTHTHICHG